MEIFNLLHTWMSMSWGYILVFKRHTLKKQSSSDRLPIYFKKIQKGICTERGLFTCFVLLYLSERIM